MYGAVGIPDTRSLLGEWVYVDEDRSLPTLIFVQNLEADVVLLLQELESRMELLRALEYLGHCRASHQVAPRYAQIGDFAQLREDNLGSARRLIMLSNTEDGSEVL